MKNRITSIDYAKGFAIMCVVLGHVLYFCVYEQHAETSPLFRFIYSFHMPLFFLLSGLVVSVKPKSLRKAFGDMKKRFLSLIMPMLLIGGFFTLLLGNYEQHFLDTDMKSGYWYLMVLFLYYLLIRFSEVITFYICANGGGKIVTILILLLVWQLLLRTIHRIPHEIISSLSLVQSQLYLPYFAVGVALNSYRNIFCNQWVLIVSGLLWCLSPMFQFHYLIHILSVLAAVFSIMCMVVIFDKHEGQVKIIMCYLGQHTLCIYCFHYFFIQLMNFSFVGYWLSDKQNIMLEFVVCLVPMIIAIIGALIINRIVQSSSFLSKLLFPKNT